MEKLKPPVEKNEYIDVAFEDLTHDGAGVAKVNGFPVFVQNALPGESGQVKVIKVKKGYGLCKLIKQHTISEQRFEAACPGYKQCAACQLQHGSYEGQLQFKQKQVKDVMGRIGHLPV